MNAVGRAADDWIRPTTKSSSLVLSIAARLLPTSADALSAIPIDSTSHQELITTTGGDMRFMGFVRQSICVLIALFIIVAPFRRAIVRADDDDEFEFTGTIST